MRLGEEFRQLGARVSEPHAAAKPELARRGVDGGQPQARPAAFNQREGQAFGRRRPPRFDP